MRLRDKIAIVTGSTSGLGRAIAELFAAEGASVTVTGRDSDRLAQVENAITNTGGNCLGVLADLTDLAEIQKLVSATVNRWGRLDVLVNAAGILAGGNFFDISEDTYDRVMSVNLKSVFFTCQTAAKEMVTRKKGKIVNFSSIGGGVIGFPGGSAYCSSKGAIVSLTQALALELAPSNINVNAISPGNILTAMNQQMFENEEYKRKILDITPSRRIGLPRDITYGALYLASDESDYVTGIQLIVDGGLVTGPASLL